MSSISRVPLSRWVLYHRYNVPPSSDTASPATKVKRAFESEVGQYVTARAVVVEGPRDIESYITSDGTSFIVSSEMRPNQVHLIHLALNNPSGTNQDAELLVRAPENLAVGVEPSIQSGDAFDVRRQERNRWTFAMSPADTGNGFFDLVISKAILPSSGLR